MQFSTTGRVQGLKHDVLKQGPKCIDSTIRGSSHNTFLPYTMDLILISNTNVFAQKWIFERPEHYTRR